MDTGAGGGAARWPRCAGMGPWWGAAAHAAGLQAGSSARICPAGNSGCAGTGTTPAKHLTKLHAGLLPGVALTPNPPFCHAAAPATMTRRAGSAWPGRRLRRGGAIRSSTITR